MPQVTVPSAAKSQLNSHSYNPVTVASLDWGEFLVSRRIECEKRDEWKRCHAKGFLRLAALDFPAYGRSFIKSAAFFVPYYQILEYFDGFRQNNLTDRGMLCKMPYVKADIINHLIHAHNGAFNSLATLVDQQAATGTWPSRSSYDLVYCNDYNSTGISRYYFYKLNQKGKRVYKWLKSLGYDFYSYMKDSTYSTVASHIPTVNALSILCYAKVWTDYFCNIHLYNSNLVVDLLSHIKHNSSYSDGSNTLYDSATGELSQLGVWDIWISTLVPFESSLYLNAWNSENSPLGSVLNDRAAPGNDSIVGPRLPDGHYSYLTSGGSETPALVPNSIKQDSDSVYLIGDLPAQTNIAHQYLLTSLSQYGINSLYAFFEFVRRNKLFGSKAVQQAFARMGIKGNDWNSQFVHKLFEASTEIDFSAVMSNANTVDSSAQTPTGSYLGAYAGVGLAALEFNYDYQVSDYGMIINLSWLQVLPMQLHGFDPSVLRIKPFDWFSPEFDGKALRAIPLMEIAEHQNPQNNQGTFPETVYGFCGIYDELRTMKDEVLGDFCLGSHDNFLFARDLSVYLEDFRYNLFPQNSGVQFMNRYGEGSGMTDPFQYDNSNGDRFYLELKFDFEASRELLSNGDSLDLEGAESVTLNTDSNPNA